MPQTITFPFTLGDEVRDIVTGFCGIIVAQTIWINGCTRVSVQAPITPDGSMSPCEVFDFDTEQCECITPRKVVSTTDPLSVQTNGPMPTPSRI